MTAEQIRQLVERTRAAQGLPPKVEHPGTLERIVALLLPERAA
jgi:hypothetical protein